MWCRAHHFLGTEIPSLSRALSSLGTAALRPTHLPSFPRLRLHGPNSRRFFSVEQKPQETPQSSEAAAPRAPVTSRPATENPAEVSGGRRDVPPPSKSVEAGTPTTTTTSTSTPTPTPSASKPSAPETNSSLFDIPGVSKIWQRYGPKKTFVPPKAPSTPHRTPESQSTSGLPGSDAPDAHILKTTINGPSILIGLGGLALYYMVSPSSSEGGAKHITVQDFLRQVVDKEDIVKVQVLNNNKALVYVRSPASRNINRQAPNAPSGLYEGQRAYSFSIGSADVFERQLEEAQRSRGISPDEFIPVVYDRESSVVGELLHSIPSLLFLGLWIYLMRRGPGNMMRGSGGAGDIFRIGKSNVKVYNVKDSNGVAKQMHIRFSDIAGMKEAKEEIIEFVTFLKNPERFRRLGARIPKGALLVGPPGTGKTLLAKATAGEAGVPFFSISGSDFMEMFVGVGPSRVRDLFAQARKSAPSIIFIDEIDAIGRQRGRGGITGGHDERDNTLNQMLVEMDGFTPLESVVILAGTNRPDVLDKALLRPGRFDRQIVLKNPDIEERREIFKLHLKPLKIDDDVEKRSKRMASLTPGFSGADIANVCNEAALIAAREGAPAIKAVHFEKAVDRVIGGAERRSRVLSQQEKKIVAFHEAGHATVGWVLKHTDPLLKVSIVPRGSAALGYAQYLPKDGSLYTLDQLLDMMCMTLGGRVAERIVFDHFSTGAQDDLRKVTGIAQAICSTFGMNERIGHVSFPEPKDGELRFTKLYSDHLAEQIDEEVRRLVDSQYERTIQVLLKYEDQFRQLAMELFDKEVIDQNDVYRILGPRPLGVVHDLAYEFSKADADVTTTTTTTAAVATDEVPPPPSDSATPSVSPA